MLLIRVIMLECSAQLSSRCWVVMSDNSQEDLFDLQKTVIYNLEQYLKEAEMEIKDPREPTIIEYEALILNGRPLAL